MNEVEQIRLRQHNNELIEQKEMLKEKITSLKFVLDGEKCLNINLKDSINTLQFTIKELSELNDKYLKKIGQLQGTLKRLIEQK